MERGENRVMDIERGPRSAPVIEPGNYVMDKEGSVYQVTRVQDFSDTERFCWLQVAYGFPGYLQGTMASNLTRVCEEARFYYQRGCEQDLEL